MKTEYLGRNYTIIIIALFWLLHTGFLIPTIERIRGLSPGESNWYLIGYIFCFINIIIISTQYEIDILPWLKRHWPILLFPAITVASITWSANATMSIKRSGLMVLTTFAVFRGVRQISFRDFLVAIFYSIFLANIINLLGILFTPSWTLHSIPGEPALWRGFFTQKNELGRFAGFSLLLVPVIWDMKISKFLIWIHVSLGITLLFLSGSKTSQMVILILFSGRWIWTWLGTVVDIRLRRRIFILIAFAFIVAIISSLPLVMEKIGRDISLTGRTKIWLFAFIAGMKHPFLGVGYGVFWQSNGSISLDVTRFAGLNPHTHNAFFDVWLDLGCLGLGAALIFILKILQQPRNLINHAHMLAYKKIRWIAVWALFSNFTETGLFTGGFQWITLIALFDYVNPEGITKTSNPNSDIAGYHSLEKIKT